MVVPWQCVVGAVAQAPGQQHNVCTKLTCEEINLRHVSVASPRSPAAHLPLNLFQAHMKALIDGGPPWRVLRRLLFVPGLQKFGRAWV